jgi:hypothetical protein
MNPIPSGPPSTAPQDLPHATSHYQPSLFAEHESPERSSSFPLLHPRASSPFSLLRLSTHLRTIVFELGLGCESIHFYRGEVPKPRKRGFSLATHYAGVGVDYLKWKFFYGPDFQVFDPRKGRRRFRGLSTLFLLTGFNHKFRNETESLIWPINVFYVSAQRHYLIPLEIY